MPKKPTSPSESSASQISPAQVSPAQGNRRRTSKVSSEASDRSPATQTMVTTSEEVLANASAGAGAALAAQPTYDEIAQAAYQRYLTRGATDGHDMDDWIEAERELRERGR
jgi:hypothetical protein